MILLHCKMASMHCQNSDLRALGIYIGVVEILKCGAIVQMENYGRIQPFLIQYTIHLSLVAPRFGVSVIPQMVLLVIVFLGHIVILEKWKVSLAIFKLLKSSILPNHLQVELRYYHGDGSKITLLPWLC